MINNTFSFCTIKFPDLDYVAHLSVWLSNLTLYEAMHNMSEYQVPLYYQPQQILFQSLDICTGNLYVPKYCKTFWLTLMNFKDFKNFFYRCNQTLKTKHISLLFFQSWWCISFFFFFLLFFFFFLFFSFFLFFFFQLDFVFPLQRQGRSDSYATEFDLEAEEYVPLPKGDVHKKKEVIQDVTLHDLDTANARPQVSFFS